MTFRSLVVSLDTLLSAGILTVSALALPSSIPSVFALSFFNVGITVLAIIFSLFFTAIAIIMASSDNDFIEFLQEEGDFDGLLNTFGVTLGALFLSLVLAIVAYIWTDYCLKVISERHTQSSVLFLVFEFFFSYSLIATVLSVKDTIRFSKTRVQFFSASKENRKQ